MICKSEIRQVYDAEYKGSRHKEKLSEIVKKQRQIAHRCEVIDK